MIHNPPVNIAVPPTIRGENVFKFGETGLLFRHFLWWSVSISSFFFFFRRT